MKVYVVEWDSEGVWVPVTGLCLYASRKDAGRSARLFRKSVTGNSYRIATYIRVEREPKPKGGKRRTKPNQGER